MLSVFTNNGVPISNLNIDEVKQLPVWDALPLFGSHGLIPAIIVFTLLGVGMVLMMTILLALSFDVIVTLYNLLQTKSWRMSRKVSEKTMRRLWNETIMVRILIAVSVIAYLPIGYFGVMSQVEYNAWVTANAQITREALAEHYDLSDEFVQEIIPNDNWYENLTDRKTPVVIASAENVAIPTSNDFVILPQVLVVQEGSDLTLNVMENDLSPSIPINKAIQTLALE